MRGFHIAKLTELATKAELADLRSETKAESAALRAETKTASASLRGEMQAALAGLRSETKAEFGDVRREMAELRLEIMQQPTRRQSIFDVFAIVGLIGAVLTIAARFAH